MTETINEQLKKLISKFNSIQGSLLSMGKRLTALEERKVEITQDVDNKLLFKVANYLGIKEEDEVVEDEKEEFVELTPEEFIEAKSEEVDQETLDALDEIIEG